MTKQKKKFRENKKQNCEQKENNNLKTPKKKKRKEKICKIKPQPKSLNCNMKNFEELLKSSKPIPFTKI